MILSREEGTCCCCMSAKATRILSSSSALVIPLLLSSFTNSWFEAKLPVIKSFQNFSRRPSKSCAICVIELNIAIRCLSWSWTCCSNSCVASLPVFGRPLRPLGAESRPGPIDGTRSLARRAARVCSCSAVRSWSTACINAESLSTCKRDRFGNGSSPSNCSRFSKLCAFAASLCFSSSPAVSGSFRPRRHSIGKRERSVWPLTSAPALWLWAPSSLVSESAE
mmetsp:Transcript_2039/g.5632  ORF Transcript_2039/g.5632 Transcript_2039/m.5632 type:complete len:223 (+) Transcript_2039:556-1224(+)